MTSSVLVSSCLAINGDAQWKEVAGNIFFNQNAGLFLLQGTRSTYAFRVADISTNSACLNGNASSTFCLPQHLYWGEKVTNFDDLSYLAEADGEIMSFDAGPQNSKLFEYSNDQTGDFRVPSFRVRFGDDGSVVSALRYRSFEAFDGCGTHYENHIPHFRENSENLRNDEKSCSTVVVELWDELKRLRVKLRYSLFWQWDSITRSVEFSNESDDIEMQIESAFSFTVDFPQHSQGKPYHWTQLSGSWARERHIVSKRLDVGLTSIESRRGASSHQHNPAIVISEGTPDENQGSHFAFALVYPGSFEMKAEVTQSGTLRVLGGLHSDYFRHTLYPKSKRCTAQSELCNHSFVTPEAVLTYGFGMESLTTSLHGLIRYHLLPDKSRSQWHFSAPRPILVNSWEAMYFNCSEQAIMERLVEPAKEMGIDMVVLDDGWFGNRFDDRRALGDWFVNYDKFPSGLRGLGEKIRSKGLLFGIWMEPEMISKDSNLYRSHPDWCLHVPGRERTEGRNQLVLDLSRADVQDFIIKSVSNVLQDSQATYLKWDFNRHLTEIGSALLDPNRQGEIYHLWVLGLYKVLYKITSAHPHVLFEQCSGGGGRYDLAMMYFSSQIWASDNTDALARIPIQKGSLSIYPANVMASHVSAVPNHQLHRTTTLTTRHVMAMSGILGYELDLASLNWQEKSLIKRFISLYKERVQYLILSGKYYRLSPFICRRGSSDFDPIEIESWMFVSGNQSEAVVSAILTGHYDLVVRPGTLKLRGLHPDYLYNVEFMRQVDSVQLGTVKTFQLHGSTLMNAGLYVKWWYDSDSYLILLKQVEKAQFLSEQK